MSIERPPWGKYLLALVTMQWMVPPHRKKSEQSRDIFHGKFPMTTPFVTEYRSAAFLGSLSHYK